MVTKLHRTAVHQLKESCRSAPPPLSRLSSEILQAFSLKTFLSFRALMLPPNSPYRFLEFSNRIDIMPGFLSSRPNWLPPPPHPQASVAPLPLVQGEHSHLRIGGGEGANSEEKTGTLVLYRSVPEIPVCIDLHMYCMYIVYLHVVLPLYVRKIINGHRILKGLSHENRAKDGRGGGGEEKEGGDGGRLSQVS
jgi:hypothetical protein